jgi:hypothetical protein
MEFTFGTHCSIKIPFGFDKNNKARYWIFAPELD